MEQPNLIGRPILIQGRRLCSGSTRMQYPEGLTSDEQTVRIGTSGWSYPAGKAPGTASSIPPPGRERRRAADSTSCGSTPSTSTRWKSTRRFTGPAPATARGWAERTPPDFEFSLKLFQKFTHPGMFQKATGGDPCALGEKDVDEFRAAIEPLASPKLGALLAQFPASFKNESGLRAATWSGCCSSSRTIRSPLNCGIEAGAMSPADMLQLLDRSARHGLRSMSRNSAPRSGRTSCPT